MSLLSETDDGACWSGRLSDVSVDCKHKNEEDIIPDRMEQQLAHKVLYHNDGILN